MDNEDRQPGPFNQQAALEELERFGRDIERYRAQREAIGEQFENFIRSFETPRPSPSAPVKPMPVLPQVAAPATAPAGVPPVENTVAQPADPGTATAVTPAIVDDSHLPVVPPPFAAGWNAGAAPAAFDHDADVRSVTPPFDHDGDTTGAIGEAGDIPRASPAVPHDQDPAADTPAVVHGSDIPTVTPPMAGERGAVSAIVHDSDAPAIVDGRETSREVATPAPESTAARAATPPARSKSASPALVGGALLAAVAGGLLVMTLWNRGGETAAPATVAPETPVAAPDPTPAPATPPPAAAVAPAPAESEITTIRHVWMRVTVDGQRVLEREVAAGTRIPLKAEQSIVIRTGDAGAVQLSIRGERRGSLGAEGEVVTRSFTVPPRAPAAPAGR